MESRLTTIAPKIEELLVSLPQDTTQSLAIQISTWARQTTGVSSHEIEQLIEVKNNNAIHAYAEELDNLYFTYQHANPAKALHYFSQARAINSTMFALENKPNEAVYEAIIATDDSATVMNFFRKVAPGG